MVRRGKGKKRKPAARNRIGQRLSTIEREMVRIDDLTRIYDDLEEIKSYVVRKKRRPRLSLFSRKSNAHGDNGDQGDIDAPVTKQRNQVDIQKAIQMAQNPIVQKMIKDFLK